MIGPMSQTPTTEPRVAPRIYRHFKGGEYEVLSVGRHTETDELVVIYRSLEDPTTVWVRPQEMFTDEVELPAGKLPRFQLRDSGDAASERRGLIWMTVRALADLAARADPLARRVFRPPASR